MELHWAICPICDAKHYMATEAQAFMEAEACCKDSQRGMNEVIGELGQRARRLAASLDEFLVELEAYKEAMDG